MINSVDDDKNGTIEMAEFIKMMSQIHVSLEEREEDLRSAFRIFDKDGNG